MNSPQDEAHFTTDIGAMIRGMVRERAAEVAEFSGSLAQVTPRSDSDGSQQALSAGRTEDAISPGEI